MPLYKIEALEEKVRIDAIVLKRVSSTIRGPQGEVIKVGGGVTQVQEAFTLHSGDKRDDIIAIGKANRLANPSYPQNVGETIEAQGVIRITKISDD